MAFHGDLLVHVKRRPEILEPNETGDDAPELEGVEALLVVEELDVVSDMERERLSALSMSSRLTLFSLRIARASTSDFSSMCSVNLETTIVWWWMLIFGRGNERQRQGVSEIYVYQI